MKPYCRWLFQAIFPVLVLIGFQENASATFCFEPIEVWAETQNNCDGSVRATYYYENPNEEFCYWWFGWHCEPCPPIYIPITYIWNRMIPDPWDQGQPEWFFPGVHEAHQITFPANGVTRTWRLRYAFHTNYAHADPEQAPQDCPVDPQLDCVESVPEGYKAYFRVRNWNTQGTNLPVGYQNKFQGVAQNQGQPTYFPAYPEETFFTWMWDGEAARWRLKNAGQEEYAPEEGFIDAEYINTHSCENMPVNPEINCIYNNNDGTLTGWFGYESFRPDPADIPIGTGVNYANMFFPIAEDQGQPTTFEHGLHEGVLSVDWDPFVQGDTIGWWLYFGEPNPWDTAYAHSQCFACAQILPQVCIKQTLEGNQAGYLTAWLGYANDNNFEISIPEGPLNNLSGDYFDAEPVVETFVPGGVNPFDGAAFTFKFNDANTAAWTVAGESAMAGMDAALCEPNELASCQINGQTGLDCGGVETGTALTAQGTDPEGRSVTYSWELDCGDNATFEVTGADDETFNLSLIDPGLGIPVGEGNCRVTLFVSDGFDSSSCEAEISASACDLDCASAPFTQGSDPIHIVDECGECLTPGDPNFNQSCADCAGVPNGSSVYDSNDTCCLESELDQCGVCLGDGQSCLGCDSINIFETQADMDSGAGFLKRQGIRAANRAQRAGASRKKMKKIKNTLKSLFNSMWTLSWKTPTVVQSCTNTELCVSISNVDTVSTYSQQNDEMLSLVKKAVRQWRKVSGDKRDGRRIQKSAEQQHAENVRASSNVPLETSACS